MANTKQQQARANYVQGAEWEAVVEKAMLDKFPANFEKGQHYGGSRPDFMVHNNDGERIAFVEVKSRTAEGNALPADAKATGADLKQALAALEQAGAGCELIHVSPSGEKFWTPEQRTELAAKEATTGASFKPCTFEQFKTLVSDRLQTLLPLPAPDPKGPQGSGLQPPAQPPQGPPSNPPTGPAGPTGPNGPR